MADDLATWAEHLADQLEAGGDRKTAAAGMRNLARQLRGRDRPTLETPEDLLADIAASETLERQRAVDPPPADIGPSPIP